MVALIRSAIQMLKANGLRFGLTMLGIMDGIAAVIVGAPPEAGRGPRGNLAGSPA